MDHTLIFLVLVIIAYFILFYYLAKEHKQHISLTKKYQKLKYEHDDMSRNSQLNFLNAERERDMKHEVINIVNLLTKEGFTYGGVIQTPDPPVKAASRTVYYSQNFEKYFIIYDKDHSQSVSVSDIFVYPKEIH